MPDWRFLFEKYALQKHQFEPLVRKYVQSLSGELFVDVGANIGYYSKILAKRFTRVVAVEPNPYAQPHLRKRLPKNVSILTVALTDSKGKVSFYVAPNRKKGLLGGGGTGIFEKWDYKPPGNLDHKEERFPVQVESDTFDNVFPDERADLVKIDVERAEFLVLKGMTRAIRSGRVSRLIIELHDEVRTNELVIQTLSPYFSIRHIDPSHILAERTGA